MYLIVSGAVLVLGSFLFALWNMAASAASNNSRDIEAGFKKHLGSMAGVAIGSFLLIGGAANFLVNYLQNH
jgi:hypothetical protein